MRERKVQERKVQERKVRESKVRERKHVSIGNNRLLRLLRFTGKWWPIYVIGILGTSMQSFGSNLIFARSLKGLTQAGLARDMGLLHRELFTMGIRLLIFILAVPLFAWFFQSSVARTTAHIRSRLFHQIQQLSMKQIAENHSGDLLSRMTNDVQTAENAYGWQLALPLMAVLSGIGSIVVIFSIHPKMGWMGIFIGAACALLNTLFARPIKKTSDRIQRHLSESTQALTDILAGDRLSRIFNLNQRLFAYYASANLGVRDTAMKRIVYQSMLNGMNGLMSAIGFVGVLIAGSVLALNGEIAFSEIVPIVQMMNGITWMFTSIGNFVAQLQGSLAGADRIFELLDASVEETPERKEGTLPDRKASKAPKAPAVSFRNVCFSYETGQNVLNGFDADVEQNRVTALVGMSGSGKSTLFRLLLGFYPLDQGDIYLFGRPIRDCSLQEIRSRIAYVPQESYLFSGTIRENIGYGRMGASPGEIEKAAKAAYADDFIRELPDGYDTQVGERGARLSGGQRQRIAIARALLKNAPILLLDEATASLDTESEHQVQKALEVLMEGRTVLIVAHRLSTIQNADRILVMEKGRICEQGTHSDLLDLNQVYAGLYRMQYSQFSSCAAL